MRVTVKEADVLRACLDYLKLSGVLCWRNNTGATVARNAAGRKRFIRFGAPGSSDILGVLPGGKFLAVETKRPGGKLSVLQSEFLAAVTIAGGVALCVSDVRELQRQLAELGYGRG
jgi:hypothetical protein